MLDEVIEYLKQLQAQVQMMSMRSMPQMMVPLGMQQHLQMSLLARMGMGMLDINSMARFPSQSLPPLMHPSPVTVPPTFLPPFVAPPMIPTREAAQANSDAISNASVPLPDPYCALLAQVCQIYINDRFEASQATTLKAIQKWFLPRPKPTPFHNFCMKFNFLIKTSNLIIFNLQP